MPEIEEMARKVAQQHDYIILPKVFAQIFDYFDDDSSGEIDAKKIEEVQGNIPLEKEVIFIAFSYGSFIFC